MEVDSGGKQVSSMFPSGNQVVILAPVGNGNGGHDRYEEELARVLASESLRNNPALRKLLAYLAEASRSGRPEALKEYSIGREAMGKPADYDPRIDSSVRVQVGKLRHKLEEYYYREAPHSPVQLQLPKGGFELVLREAPQRLAFGEKTWKRIAIGASAAAIILSLLTISLLLRTPRQPAMSSEVRSVWGPFLKKDRPLMFVVGVPFFIRFGPVFFRNPYVNDMDAARRSLDLDGIRRIVAPDKNPQESRRFTGLGEAFALFEVTRLLAGHDAQIHVKRASVLDWEDLRTNNMVIIGPPKFAPQTRDVPLQQDFVFEGSSIINLKPAPGEAVRFHKTSGPDPEKIDEEYALITYATNVPGWGDLIILASSSSEATWAAAEAVTNSHHLKRLWPRLCRPGARLPPAWQLVIRAKFRDQVPIDIQYVTHHVLDRR
jgi:hypothetical protein